jgi:MFS family permease
MVYFGMLSYLAMYFNQYVGLDDQRAAWMVGVLTSGITISMFFLGGLSDRWGVRTAILASFALMLVGRLLISVGPSLGLPAGGLWSHIHLLAMAGILVVVIGYGMYQPACYSAIREFTTPQNSAMGYAMLYAVMNLGGWLPTFFGPIRRSVGIGGAFWVYTALTGVSLLATFILLSRRTCEQAIAAAKAARARPEGLLDADGRVATDLNCTSCGYNLRTLAKAGLCPECAQPVLASFPPRPCKACGRLEADENAQVCSGCGKDLVARPAAPPAEVRPAFGDDAAGSFLSSAGRWFANHPLANAKFAFFIFALIPVQTLFAHQWMTMPQYVERAYRGSFVGTYFETAVNLNSLLIFVLTPIVAALTPKANVYRLMIIGTFVMGAPTFLLALGPNPVTLFTFLLLTSLGEAIWSPRFLQYAAEIAPEGRTGAYMGVAQFPWFLTKVIVPIYSGWFLTRYCPETGPVHTEPMWAIYAVIAMLSTVLLVLAKGWLGKDFKTKAA